MAFLMTGEELAKRELDIARNYKTIYMYAAFGFQVTDATIARKASQNLNGWYTQDHINTLRKVANRKPPYWGFDCVNLTKGILWGWVGDESKTYGGAVHGANGVPDTNANGMMARCKEVSTDFGQIEVGEGLWIEGHWGVYVGSGMAVECTGRWDNGVQITAVHNIAKKSGMNGRYWTKHGKLPWVQYSGQSDDVQPEVITLGSRVIRKGTQGTDVKELQEALMKLGYALPKYGADGDCGSETVNAIKLFQDDAGLEVDGEAGRDTITALKARLDSGTAPETPTEKTYTIILRHVPQAEMEAMGQRWPTAEVMPE